MKTQLYILGLLLRYGPQHGYLLKQTVEEQISDFAQIKLPTIYYHLEKLNQKGYIAATLEKDGSRPEKTVYSITSDGEKHFYSLLKKMQSEEMSIELPFDGVIYFRDKLDSTEFADAVKKSARILEEKLDRVLSHRDQVLGFIPDSAKKDTIFIFNHHIYHLQAELKWMKEIEEGL